MSKSKSSSGLIPLLFFMLSGFFVYQYLIPQTGKKHQKQKPSYSTPQVYTPIKIQTKTPLGQKVNEALQNQPDLIPFISLVQNMNFRTQINNETLNEEIKKNLQRAIPINEKGDYGLEAHIFNSRIKGDQKIFLQLSIYEHRSNNLIGELNIEFFPHELQK